jgi:hypothetical protein
MQPRTITADDLKQMHRFVLKAKKDVNSGGIDTIKAVDEILWRDKDGNYSRRMIRLIETQKSIFADEQVFSPQTTDSTIDKMTYRFRFVDSQYVCKGSEINKLEFLRLFNGNGSNSNRDKDRPVLFHEHDVAKQARESMEKEDMRIEAEYKAKTMTFEEGKAFLMSIAKNAEQLRWAENQPADVITHEVRRYARENSKKFLEAISSSSLKMKAKISQGITLRKVKLSDDGSVLSWANGDIIVQAPAGMGAIDFLIEKAGFDITYAKTIEDIWEMAKYEAPETQKVMPVSVTEAVAGKDENKILYEKLKSAGIVKHKGVAITCEDKTWGNFHIFLKALEEDDELLIDMRKRLRGIEK